MNIEQAKRIPLAQILEKIGCLPVQENQRQSKYLSPLRNERTPSFYIHHQKNCWYDFGTGKGGSSLVFVMAWLESCAESYTVHDALRWMGNMDILSPVNHPGTFIEPAKQEPSLIFKQKRALKHPALLKYLEGRAIPLELASSYIVEVSVHNKQNKKDFFALGFANEENGYEIRNPFFKGCIGPKAISFIRGKQPKPDGIHIFEGFLDYISAISFQNVSQFDNDAIVLNSLSCLKQAIPYIKNYGYRTGYTWLDNDKPGQMGTEALAKFFETERSMNHKPMNSIYHPHKDMNAFMMQAQKLKP